MAPGIIKIVCTTHKALFTASYNFFWIQLLELSCSEPSGSTRYTYVRVAVLFRHSPKGLFRSKAFGVEIWPLQPGGMGGGGRRGLAERALSFTLLQQMQPQFTQSEGGPWRFVTHKCSTETFTVLAANLPDDLSSLSTLQSKFKITFSPVRLLQGWLCGRSHLMLRSELREGHSLVFSQLPLASTMEERRSCCTAEASE